MYLVSAVYVIIIYRTCLAFGARSCNRDGGKEGGSEREMEKEILSSKSYYLPSGQRSSVSLATSTPYCLTLPRLLCSVRETSFSLAGLTL